MKSSPQEIVDLLARYRFRYRDETQLQEGIAQVFSDPTVTSPSQEKSL
jgi:hypothetical protein